MHHYFEKLGAHLDKAWSGIDRDEEGFSDIAVTALKSFPPLEHLEIEGLVDGLLDIEQAIPRQFAPLGAFGQPGVTVFYGRGFVIDIYFWTESLSAIHDHPFCGAFTLLKGFSVHARYQWQEQQRYGPGVRLGSLDLKTLEIVNCGDVGAFGRGRHHLIHALLHVPIPSISMVVRTMRADGYLKYFPPGVALSMDPPDDLIERQLMLLEALRKSADPDFEKRFSKFLLNANFETVFRSLSRMWFGFSDAHKDHYLEIARQQHGNGVDSIRAALNKAQQKYGAEVLRAQLIDSDDRLITTALMLADDRKALLKLLSMRHADPIERMHRFVMDSGVFTDEDEASALLIHALIDGEDSDGAIGRVAERFGAESVKGHEKTILEYCSAGPFAPLLLSSS